MTKIYLKKDAQDIESERTAKIRGLNNALRTARDPVGALMWNGSLVITRALADKGNAFIDHAVEAMRTFSDFNPNNAPYGGHDFAAFDVGGERCNFKVDYYSPDLEHGSEASWDAGVTRAAVGELIDRECGIEFKVRAVGNYLKRWGFTPQKPIKRAYEQRPEAVKAWIDEAYPAIAARAKAEGGEIQWGDETALVNTDVRGRSYAPRGETPVAYAPGPRQKLSMISTVTNKGKARWMIIDGNFGADKLIEFLTALIKATRKKVFLILDNLRAHHTRPVKEWLGEP